MEIANTNCKNIFDNDNNDENHRISLIGYILPESIQALASLLQLITCIHAVDRVIPILILNLILYTKKLQQFDFRESLHQFIFSPIDTLPLSKVVVLMIR